MKWIFAKRNHKFIGLALIILIASYLFFYLQSRQYEQQQSWLYHTHEVEGRTELLLSLLKDAEMEQRNYLLTGDERYLQSYQKAIEIVGSEFQHLRQLTRDHSHQHDQVNALEQLLKAKIAELDKLMDVHQNQGAEAAVALVRTKQGQQLTEEIRKLAQEIPTLENQLLQQHHQLAKSTFRAMALCFLLTFLLIALVSFLLYREQIKHQQVEQAQRYAGILKLRVAERTTQLNQANALLRENERLLKAIFEHSAVGIVVTDLNGRFVKVNPAYQKLLGYSNSALQGMRFFDLTHEDDRPKYQALFTELLQGERDVFQIEKRSQCRDGSVIWVRKTVSLIPAQKDQPKLAIAIAENISDRKQAESELRKSEEQRRLVLDLTHIATWDWKFATGEVIWNENHFRLLGLVPGETKSTYQLWRDRVHPEDINRVEQAVNHALETHSDYQAEYRVIHPDGSLHWVMGRARGLYNSEGKPVRMLGMVIEISDRKQAEEQLRQLSAALEIRVQERTRELQESEERFRSAFDNAVNGMALVSPAGHLLKVNPALCEILGYSEQEFLEGLSLDEITHSDDLERHLNARYQILAGEISRIQIEKRYIHKLGHFIWVICSASLVRDTQGELLYLVMQIQDITERRAIDKMKNEFISVVSHELRTPLASIRGSLGLLAAGVLDNEPEATKQMLSIAASESERLVRMVNDILDLERLEANKITLNQQWCDAADLIQQAMETLRPLALENNITISFLPSRVQIWADQDWIIQILVNLLCNAIKFSLPLTTVTISASDQADRVLFAVKDQGRGIPADKVESIFGRFQQVDASDSRQKGGTGLGLAICRQIVQQHGGRIWAESISGKGSTFYFTLPIPLE
jgi:PAS domain S-box-containing protein